MAEVKIEDPAMRSQLSSTHLTESTERSSLALCASSYRSPQSAAVERDTMILLELQLESSSIERQIESHFSCSCFVLWKLFFSHLKARAFFS